jgi:hypothetical protein
MKREMGAELEVDNHKGAITLNKLAVTAVVDGELPRDSIDQLVSIG